MIPAQFDYVAPTTLEEALTVLAEHGDDAKIIAGGQSLLPVLRMRLNAPEVVVDISGIASLKGITDTGDAIRIGAATTYQEVLDSDLVREHLRLLHQAVSEVADPQIRHRGTLCGALAHADPAGDVGAPVLALDGRTYRLDEGNVVIADDNGIESIGGIMGGEHSGCDEGTTSSSLSGR